VSTKGPLNKDLGTYRSPVTLLSAYRDDER